ncbi:MAG: alanine--tRNA ligase [Clostridia bacterium]|nr:alanine--tRNA ligase [Clostridia bacterium]
MEKMGLNQIREEFLSFFQEKAHLRMQSFPLVPINDNSLLLINAGMAPLKKYFTGEETPPSKRVTTCQKCIRTPDIERVGKTARHGTFFEMLGNFSFGDYFKNEVTGWAWEFITERMKLPVDRLWVSVYQDDDEAYDIWTKKVGVSPDRMVRLGKEDNFWEIGTGPCGPCSEIYFDRGVENGCGSPDCAVGCDCDRFVEFWNLVFTQFDKDKDGNYNRLAHPNIDTGMGLERIAAIMQGVGSLFEVDTVKRVLDTVCQMSGKTYGAAHETDVSIRVVTDHIRSTVFLVSDGVIPSNEGRGYVLRRLLRRAARHGKLLGIDKMFLTELADVVISQSKDAYPELEEKQDYIKKIISTEEEKFYKTIDAGLLMLSDFITEMKAKNETVFDGEVAFKLYDTYGFPLDLTKEVVEENGFTLDEDKYQVCMNEQREKARNARGDTSTLGWENEVAKLIKDLPFCEFIGYDNLTCDATVTAILKDGELVETLDAGESGTVLTNTTVFYGESGGQAGDTGLLGANGVKAVVTDTTKYTDGKFGHMVTVETGVLEKGATISMEVDKAKRLATARNHSTTHLLQKALQTVLGDHVHQAGSYVTPERLRFDFAHFEAMTPEEIEKTESLVNDAILSAMEINCRVMPIDEAKKLGAMALFGEKYGDNVRVVTMGDYSMEFCGGTHLTNTAQAGLFKIVSESGVAAGVRRIEAVTGTNYLEFMARREELLKETAKVLKVNNLFDLPARAIQLNDDMKAQKHEMDELRAKLSKGEADEILNSAKDVAGVALITAQKEGATVDMLRNLCDELKNKYGENPVVIVLSNLADDKITFLASANKAAVAKGAHAGNIIREVTKAAGGSGGGKPDMAQGGGKDASKIADALAIAEEVLKGQL